MNMKCVTPTNGLIVVAYKKIFISLPGIEFLSVQHSTVIIARSGNVFHYLARTCLK